MELHVRSGLLFHPQFKELCQKHGNQFVLIADEALKDLYATKLAEFLNADLFLIPNKKTKETLDGLIHQILPKKYGRDTLFLSLGGGAITDLVGFLASTFLRGVPLIHLPTSLLAMVDAAIGGKTGIDTPFGKNLIGTFYPPQAIVADLDTLKTLPEKEWIHGRSEMVKMGLIFDPLLFRSFDIEKAMQAKLQIVTQDPFETGLRRILNFGHTIGHALETVCGIPHGEAVAIGCYAESHLSYQLGYLKKEEFDRVPKTSPLQFDRNAFFEALHSDKKKHNGQIRCVLIDRIGHAAEFDGAYCRPVTQEELLPTLDLIYG